MQRGMKGWIIYLLLWCVATERIKGRQNIVAVQQCRFPSSSAGQVQTRGLRTAKLIGDHHPLTVAWKPEQLYLLASQDGWIPLLVLGRCVGGAGAHKCAIDFAKPLDVNAGIPAYKQNKMYVCVCVWGVLHCAGVRQEFYIKNKYSLMLFQTLGWCSLGWSLLLLLCSCFYFFLLASIFSLET